MEHQKIDLDQIKRHYTEWLSENKRSFNTRRETFVMSLGWIEPESVLNAGSVLQYWQTKGASRPSAWLILSELCKAGIVVKTLDEGALAYVVKPAFFGGGNRSYIV